MGQSLVQNYIHIVFSTKYRKHSIDQTIEKDLHAYLGAICNHLGCHVLKVGGYTNHIHILCMLSKKIALMTLMQELKAKSSKWVKSKGEDYSHFFWQDGYGAFSVRPKDVQVVVNYIAHQKQHHQRKSFKQEYRVFLKEYNVDYDERYVWD